MRKSRKSSKQITITFPIDSLIKYKNIKYLKKAQVASFSELLRKAMDYYNEKLIKSSNKLKNKYSNRN